MSTWSGGDKGTRKQHGWRGGRERETKPAFSWQGSSSRPKGGDSSRRRRELRWGIYALLGAVLLGVFLYILLIRPSKTPLLVATGIGYGQAVSPNAGVDEDRRGLEQLNQTLEVREIDGSWLGSGAEARQTFAARLARHQATRRGFRRIREPLIIYFSMPGVVDRRGVPCLLPPGASAYESDQWLPLDWVLEQIAAETSPERSKLLVLDSNQHLVSWPMGIAYNTFVERLEELLAGTTVQNLAVLTAAGKGQASFSAPELGGTPFGQYLRLGLAGAADQTSSEPDGEVSLLELGEYLRREVDRWALACRGARQTPWLWKSNAELDFFVTHALSDGALEEHREQLAAGPATITPIATDRLGSLWRQYDRLLDLDAVRYDPLGQSQLRQRLVRLEQLAYAGAAYHSEAERVAEDLESVLQAALDRAGELGPALADHWAVLNPGDAGSVRLKQQLYTLPLREYFGVSTPVVSQQIEQLWQQLENSVGDPDPPTIEIDASLIADATRLVDTQLLVAAHQHDVHEFPGNLEHLAAVRRIRTAAESLAVPRDPSGAPGDERIHYFVRRMMDSADGDRRAAEDVLFVDVATAAERQRLALGATRSMASAAEVRDQLSSVVALSDQLHAELPLLAGWLARPTGEGGPALSDEEAAELLSLVAEHHALAAALGDLTGLRDPEADVSQVSLSLVAKARGLTTRRQQFRPRYDEAAKELTTGAAEDGQELLAIEQVLSAPLMSGELRGDLLAARDDLAVALRNKHFRSASSTVAQLARSQGAAASDSGASTAGDAAPLAEAMTGWSSPLLLAVLGVDAESVGGNDLEAVNWAARDALRRLQESRYADSPNVGADSLAYLDARLALSRSARQVRAAAALLPDPPGVDPVARLRRFDLQQLCLWHARRSVDDFWHEVTGPDPKTVAQLRKPPARQSGNAAPLFTKMAEDYVRIAEQLTSELPEAVGVQILALDRLTEQRTDASRYGLQLDATSERTFEGEGDVAVDLRVAAHPKGSNLPAGVAAVYVAHEKNRIADLLVSQEAWGSAAMPVTADQPASLRARASRFDTPQLDAVAFFRGREYRQNFDVPLLEGALVELQYPVYDRQSVTLRGDQPNPPSVAFILDCSGSMQTLIETEIEGVMKPRMEAAVSVLDIMLSELSQRSRATRPRVGMWFFGHRLKWKNAGGRPVVDPNKTAADGAIPSGMAPAEDVEHVLSLGLFGPRQFGMVSERLKRLEPYGLTPVNLAILKALEQDFRKEGDDVSKSIIVITDGKNDQRHPQGAGFKAISTTTTEQVIRAWDRVGKQIPVFIVGFGIPEGERGEAEREFKKIADHTGGDWLPTDSGAELIEHLRKRLDVHGYVVRDGQGRPVTVDPVTGDPQPLELNTEVEISARDHALPSEMEVAFRTVAEKVVFEGGEELKLQLARNGDIIGVPYNRDVGKSDELVEGESGQPTDYLLRVHRPRRTGDRVRFRFSVQDQQSHFTPRPKEIWVEVTPRGGKNQYIYYDAVYEPYMPVPVVGFTASKWPAEADQAEVRFWCSNDRTEAVKTIRLAEVGQRDLASVPFQAVPAVAGVEVRAAFTAESTGQYVVQVDERFASDGSRGGLLRVSVEAKDPSITPQAASRQYDLANRIARHRFRYASSLTPRQFAEQIAVRFTSAEAIKSNAMHLANPEGLRVTIIEDDATHVPTAAK